MFCDSLAPDTAVAGERDGVTHSGASRLTRQSFTFDATCSTVCDERAHEIRKLTTLALRGINQVRVSGIVKSC